MIKIKNLKEKMNCSCVKSRTRIVEALNNEKGNGLILGILFTAITIGAILLIAPDIKTLFSDIFTSVKEWLIDQVDSVLS